MGIKKYILFIVVCFSCSSVNAIPLAEMSGETSADLISANLAVSISGNSGDSPAGRGYWTSAVDTGTVTSNSDIYTSFTFTAIGLGEDEFIDLNSLTFDYIKSSLPAASQPQLDVYIDTGNGYGASVLTETGDDSTISLSVNSNILLFNGESVTFGFSFKDVHQSSARTHMIDNIVLDGDLFTYNSALAELSGEVSADTIVENLTVSINGNAGDSPAGRGYWTSAANTGNTTSSSDIYASFTFTATGLDVNEAMDLSGLTFDYLKSSLSGSQPQLDVYINTGNGYGDSVLTETGVDTSISLILPVNLSLSNGESVTFGFSFKDIHGLEARTHMIDNVVLSGTLVTYTTLEASVLAELSGETSADSISEYLSLNIAGNTGDSPAGRGYWTSAANTGNSTSNTNIHTSFTFTATGLGANETIDLTRITFDYETSSLDGSSPEFDMYIDTGSGYGSSVLSQSDEMDDLSLATEISLQNGESVTFGFSFRDGHGLVARTHLIDDVVITGAVDLFSTTLGVDLNNNGVSDIWEYRYGASRLVSNVVLQHQDYDGDGISNIGESIAGTDPFDSRSALRVYSDLQSSNGISLFVPSIAGKRYSVESTDTLLTDSWTLEDDQLLGDGGDIEFLMSPNGDDQHFFRILVSDVDADSDRLTLWEENALNGFDDNDQTSDPGDPINDYDRLKRIIYSVQESSIAMTTDGTMLYEEGDQRVAVTFTRIGNRDDGFLDLAGSHTYRIINTTQVASNAATDDDYMITDVDGNEISRAVVTLPAGESSVTVYVKAKPDNVVESDEQLTLSVPGEGSMNIWIADAQEVPLDDYTAIAQAGHFLSQASMGGTPATISALANDIKEMGQIAACEAWIDNQLTIPRGSTVTDDCFDHQEIFLLSSTVPSINIQNFELVWWGKMIQTEEQLRHRMAFTLSQVFVTSSAFWANQERNDLWRSYTSYYDKLADAAFSNHRDLLQTISYDPFMGVYLSSAQNRKADTSLGTSPDENYAREVMQLFSCGVYSQNNRGEFILNGNDRIENYDNDDITELAEVFTGLGLVSWDGELDNFDSPNATLGTRYIYPMQMSSSHHDTSSKILLDGSVLPAGQSGDEDISDALDVLASHPSTAPHLARLLIKRLTNSNPSGDYIARVTEAWSGQGTYGNGEVGDFVSIIKAILLDPEARGAINFQVNNNTGEVFSSPALPTAGRIKEPILKWLQFYRFSEALSGNDDGLIRVQPKTKQASNDQTPDFGQIPMRAPSVFNYYDSDYSPSVGALAEAEATYGIELTSPESEILSPFVIKQFESFYPIVDQDEPSSSFYYNAFSGGLNYVIDYSYLSYLYDKNSDVGDFIDDLNLWLCNGQISTDLKDDLVSLANANGGATNENFAKVISLIFNSSDFSIAY